jgi:thiamine biosynthesis protein ThiS
MELFINGQKETIGLCTIDELVQQRGFKAESLIVELNRNIIKQAQWPETHLQENDEVELLSFVGGG